MNAEISETEKSKKLGVVKQIQRSKETGILKWRKYVSAEFQIHRYKL